MRPRKKAVIRHSQKVFPAIVGCALPPSLSLPYASTRSRRKPKGYRDTRDDMQWTATTTKFERYVVLQQEYTKGTGKRNTFIMVGATCGFRLQASQPSTPAKAPAPQGCYPVPQANMELVHTSERQERTTSSPDWEPFLVEEKPKLNVCSNAPTGVA
jgi:hypothetical protein